MVYVHTTSTSTSCCAMTVSSKKKMPHAFECGLGCCPLADIALESQDRTLKQTLSQRELHHERDPIGRMSLNKPCPISMHTTRSCSRPLKHAANKLLSASLHTHLMY